MHKSGAGHVGVPSPGGQLFRWHLDARRLAPWQHVWPRAEPQTLSAGDVETATKARTEEVLAMGALLQFYPVSLW